MRNDDHDGDAENRPKGASQRLVLRSAYPPKGFYSPISRSPPHPLEWERKGSPGNHLLHLFSSSPDIPSYVRQIAIFEVEDLVKTWLRDDLALGQALEKIDPSQIKAFRLHLTGSLVPGYTGKVLPEQTRKAIIGICHSPTLIELSLWGSPFDPLNYCGPSIRRLTV
ncbi:hypothetical protein NMY22_g211 [Coprinellus aureogranulatus]|nr:hypothetical protein NMY22_g211 [Coprinellus aureogranulatus]